MSCGKTVKTLASGAHISVQQHGFHVSKSTASDQAQSLYENAIKMLNTLQLKRGIQKDNFKKAERFAEIAKVPAKDLDRLAAVHVSGTKGKGSVCAFCESVLRSSGYKTGFYSSPHLVEVRERFRINGKPISKELFAHYFWECWNNYRGQPELPSYGTFVAFMSFYVFLKEKVDVAVVEVGQGGEYDGTNIIRKPVVCGVTLLEKDHLHSLGGTVESIAWHKAGIFKPNVPAFTVPQDPVSMKVLAQRARERKVLLKVVPDLSTYLEEITPALGIEGSHQRQNAALAIQICRTWLEHKTLGKHQESSLIESASEALEELTSPPKADVFPIPNIFKEGLSKTYWPGRAQCIERDNLTIYLDGAHTERSIEACSSWFCDKSNEEETRKRPKRIARVLIVNVKGRRVQAAESLLQPLLKCNFDYVVFCPNILSDEPLTMTSDISNFDMILESERQKCYEIQNSWKEIIRGHHFSADSFENPKIQTLGENSRVFTCVADAFYWAVGDRDASIVSRKPTSPAPDIISRADHVQVFVTGSLYLVGMVMKLLGPEIVEL